MYVCTCIFSEKILLYYSVYIQIIYIYISPQCLVWGAVLASPPALCCRWLSALHTPSALPHCSALWIVYSNACGHTLSDSSNLSHTNFKYFSAALQKENSSKQSNTKIASSNNYESVYIKKSKKNKIKKNAIKLMCLYCFWLKTNVLELQHSDNLIFHMPGLQ